MNEFKKECGYRIMYLECFFIIQHFTTFTLPRKLMKLVYTRPELSPLDFLRFGP